MKSADDNPMRGTCMRRNEPTKRKRGWKRRLTAGVAAAGLLAALTVQPGFAAEEKPEPTEPTETTEPTEPTPYQKILEEGLSITVEAPGSAFGDDNLKELKEAGVVLDVYKIASAVEITGVEDTKYDAYEFAEDWGVFSAQKTAWDAAVAKAGETEGGSVTAADIEALTQGAAGVVLKNIPEYTPGKTAEEVPTSPDYTGALKFAEGDPAAAAISLVKDGKADPGLYLILAHGTRPDYKLTEDGSLFTIAEGETTLFEFAPMLVSVPTRGQNVIGSVKVLDENYESKVGDTAAEDKTWNGDITIKAKVGVKDRLGSLKITKTLNTHEVVGFGGRKDPAAFIFDVNITDKEGNEVYANVISMVFDAAGGPQEEIITGLPVGALADVTEVYAGNYKTTQKYEDIEIKADVITTAADGKETREIKTETAAFTNDWNDTWNGGGSVKNSYQPVEKSDESVEWDLSNGKVPQTYALETSAAAAPEAAK